MKRFSALLTASLVAALALPTSFQGGEDDAAGADDLLKLMNQDVVKDCFEAVAQFEKWQADLKQLRKDIEDVEKVPSPVVVAAIVDFLKQRSETFQAIEQVKRIRENLEARLKVWENKAKQAAERSRAAAETVKDFQAFLDWVKMAQNPAKLVQDFAANKLKELIKTPITIEAPDITFRILEPDPSKAFFSPDADLVVSIEYPGAGVKVQAHGMYFKMVNNVPVPKLDKERMKVDAKLEVDKGGLIKSLIKDLAAVLPLPSLGEVTPIDIPTDSIVFNDWKSANPGTLSMQVAIDLAKLLHISGTEVKLRGGIIVRTHAPKGKKLIELDVKSEMSAEIPGEAPLGPPNMMIGKAGISFKAGQDAVSFRASIYSKLAGPQGLRLDVVLTIEPTEMTLRVDGALVLNNDKFLAHVVGTITPDEINCRLTVPHEKSKGLPFATAAGGGEATLVINKTKIEANALVSLYACIELQAHILLEANGHGLLEVKGSFEPQFIPGVKVSAEVDASFKPGFQDMVMFMTLDVSLDVNPIGSVRAQVKIEVRPDVPQPAIWVRKAEAGGISLPEFRLPTLSSSLLKELTRQFEAQLQAYMANINEKMKDLDPFNKNGQLAGEMRKWKFTNPDQLGAAISNGWKKAFSDVDFSNENNDLVKVLTNPRQAAEDFGKGVVKAITPPQEKPKKRTRFPGGRPTKIKEIAEKNDMPAAVVTSLEQVEREAGFNAARLKLLVEIINTFPDEVDVRPAPTIRKTPAGTYRELTTLHMEFRHALEMPVKGSATEAEVVFFLESSGRAVTICPGKPTRSEVGKDSAWVTIHFDDIFGEAPEPTARVHVPVLEGAKNYSFLSANDYAQRTIRELIRRIFKGIDVSIEGAVKQYEKRLVINNLCDEPVTVWVHFETNRGPSGEWAWHPAEPDKPSPFKVTVAARKSEKLTYEMKKSAIEKTAEQLAEQAKNININDLLNNRRPRPVRVADTKTVPLYAHCVRIWAEGASGERWESNRHQDLYLVDRNPELRLERTYYAEEPKEYPYTIRPAKGRRSFEERSLEFYNDTKDTLNVQLKYFASENGVAKLQTLPAFPIKPGETVQPRSADGLRVLASQITFTAEGEDLLFDANKTTPLYTVEAAQGSGVRRYLREQIGTYRHTFRVKGGTGAPL